MKVKNESTTTRAPVRRGRSKPQTSVMRVEVLRSHDGINKGDILVKSRETAAMMIAKGFYKEVSEE